MSWGRFSRLLVLPHSVFALPFALSGFLLAWKAGALVADGFSLWAQLLLVVLAVVSARSAAMGFNRLLDAGIDSRNPRTAGREIPSGEVSRKEGWVLVSISSGLFFLSAGLLGQHCLLLSPFVYGILLFYSYTKRIGSYAHLVLGLALALAPGGAWWVLRPAIEATPLLLMFSVLFWVSGFDILYSCQDVMFDRANGLFSIPGRLGIDSAMLLSKSFHVMSFLGFVLVGAVAGLDWPYYVGALLLGTMLLVQHRIISAVDLKRINHAFFTLNGFASLIYFLFVAVSVA